MAQRKKGWGGLVFGHHFQSPVQSYSSWGFPTLAATGRPSSGASPGGVVGYEDPSPVQKMMQSPNLRNLFPLPILCASVSERLPSQILALRQRLAKASCGLAISGQVTFCVPDIHPLSNSFSREMDRVHSLDLWHSISP